MKQRTLILSLAICTLVSSATAAISTIQGTVTKVDSTAKTIVIKTAEGTEHTVRMVAKTTVHGSEVVGKDAWTGIKEGAEVVAHYTEKGAVKTAVEVDHVGGTGLKAVEGTVVKMDHGAKKMVVKAADGTEHTFDVTKDAASVGAKDVATGAETSAKVTVYYTEEAGKKVAHFFKRQ